MDMEEINMGQKARNILINSSGITTNRIYEGGEISEYSWAFSIILKNDNALKNFKDIFEKSRFLGGKIYALIAIFHIDKKEYYRLKATIKDENIVNVLKYCLREEFQFKDISKEIESGELLDTIKLTEIPDYTKTTKVIWD
jgi:hypothetical protein